VGGGALTIDLAYPLVQRGADHAFHLRKALNQRKELKQLLIQAKPTHQALVKECSIADQLDSRSQAMKSTNNEVSGLAVRLSGMQQFRIEQSPIISKPVRPRAN
jgi:hypothetical protein